MGAVGSRWFGEATSDLSLDRVSFPWQLGVTPFVRTVPLSVFVRLASCFTFDAGKCDAILRFVCTRTVLAVEDLVYDPWVMRGRGVGVLTRLEGKFVRSPRDLNRLGEGMKIGRCTLVVRLGPSDIHKCDNIRLQILPES